MVPTASKKWLPIIMSIAALAMIGYLTISNQSQQSEQQQVQLKFDQLDVKLDQLTSLIAKLDQSERATSDQVTSTLKTHSTAMASLTTEKFSTITDHLTALRVKLTEVTKKSSSSTPQLPDWRRLTIIEKVLQTVPPANSPYVPEDEKNGINEVATKLGGKANGCSESVYGELYTSSVMHVLNAIGLRKEDVLYDFGSGRGHVVALAFYNFMVRRAYGIEMSTRRVEIACGFASKLRSQFPPALKSEIATRSVQFAEGNFLEMDISDGTVFYMTATCFRPSLMFKISKKFLQLTQESGRAIRIVSVSERFPTAPSSEFHEQYTPQELARLVETERESVASDWTNNTAINFYTILPPLDSRAPRAFEPKPPSPAKSCMNMATEFQNYPYKFKDYPLKDNK